MFRDRWPIVPWGYPLSDLRPQGFGDVYVKPVRGGVVLQAYPIRGVPNDPHAVLGVLITSTGASAVIAESSVVVRALGGVPNFDLNDCDD